MNYERQPREPLRLATEVKSVDDFPSASRNADPFLYPGVRPEASFLLSGEQVYDVTTESSGGSLSISISTEDGIDMPINDLLEQKGAAPMEDRIAILGYGANMCPASLHAKFSKIGRDDALIVPTVYGNLDSYDVVCRGFET